MIHNESFINIYRFIKKYFIYANFFSIQFEGQFGLSFDSNQPNIENQIIDRESILAIANPLLFLIFFPN